MLKKFLYGVLLLTAIITFAISYTFATDGKTALEDAANGVRNVVGDAENGVEDAARDISNTSKDVTSNMENDASKDTDFNRNNNNNDLAGTTLNTNPGNYIASRTSTEANNGLFGMNSTAWMWLVMAVVAIAIIALVYYFSVRMTNRNDYNDNDE